MVAQFDSAVNANNPDGPLEICLCTDCGAVIMLDDKQKRIRVIVPNPPGGATDTLARVTPNELAYTLYADGRDDGDIAAARGCNAPTDPAS